MWFWDKVTTPTPAAPTAKYLWPDWHSTKYTSLCKIRVENNPRIMAEKEWKLGSDTNSRSYGHPLVTATSFFYLGRILMATDDDWPKFVRNLWKARRSWAKILQIMEGEVQTREHRGGSTWKLCSKYFSLKNVSWWMGDNISAMGWVLISNFVLEDDNERYWWYKQEVSKKL